MGIKKNNPGCKCCGGEPCGPDQTVCEDFSPNKKVRWVDVEISGIPDAFDAEVERSGVPGARHELSMTGLSALNGTYRIEFDEELCEWEGPVFTYSGYAVCTQYSASIPTPIPLNFCDSISSPVVLYDSSITLRLTLGLFTISTLGAETVGAPCEADWPGFSLNAALFDPCDPTEQTFTSTVNYTQCSGSSPVNLSYDVTIKLTPSLVDL